MFVYGGMHSINSCEMSKPFLLMYYCNTRGTTKELFAKCKYATSTFLISISFFFDKKFFKEILEYKIVYCLKTWILTRPMHMNTNKQRSMSMHMNMFE